MQNISLNECKKNKSYTIDSIDVVSLPIARRLTELGFIKGTEVKIIQFSALKKTLLIEIKGYVLSLRATVADMVKVKNEGKKYF